MVAFWLFTSMRGLRAVAQGVSVRRVPWNFQLLDCDLGCFRQAVGPCPFKTFTRHSLFFVTGALALGPAHRSYCPASLVSSTPCMHCVSALWCGWLGLGVLQSWAPSPSLV